MTGLTSPDIVISGTEIRSHQFDDIYFQPQDGLAEATHVFLDGNDLKARFASMPPRGTFVIGELGFGTGLNILAAAHLFTQHAPDTAHLHVWSVEGFPLSPQDLADSLAPLAEHSPEIAPWVSRLTASYPQPRPGWAQIHLSRQVTITLALGSVDEMLAEAAFDADAWFLDGFAPSKNPAMWSDEVLAAIAQHTVTGGTAATFTVAGQVRRGLTAAGLMAEKTPGFGRKREMLRGTKTGVWHPRQAPQSVSIIGAGIAGVSCAHSFARVGSEVTIIDPAPASGASGNPAGLLMPRLDAGGGVAAHFYRDAYLFAHRWYAAYSPEHIHLLPGHMAAEEHGTRFQKVIETGLWVPSDFTLSPNGDLIVPEAGLVAPKGVINTLLHDVHLIREKMIEIPDASTPDNTIVVANGPMASAFAPFEQDLSASRGQVDVFAGTALSEIRSRSKYVAPWQGNTMVGATYDPAPVDATPTADDQSSLENREGGEALLVEALGPPEFARASLRAVTTDRHPIAGPLPMAGATEHLIVTGLGSRGLSTAPLLSAHLAARASGGISPIRRSGYDLIDPGRFEKRRARRAQ